MDLLTLLQAAPAPSAWPVWSGYVLCFLPLAAVILGFIYAARATDQAATANYLRLDPTKVDPQE